MMALTNKRTLGANGEITSSSINGIAIDLNPQGCLNNGLSFIGKGYREFGENSCRTTASQTKLILNLDSRNLR